MVTKTKFIKYGNISTDSIEMRRDRERMVYKINCPYCGGLSLALSPYAGNSRAVIKTKCNEGHHVSIIQRDNGVIVGWH